MYARGMSTREIVGHVRDFYGLGVSPALISPVTDAVLDEVAGEAHQPRAGLDQPLAQQGQPRGLDGLRRR